MKSHFGLKTYQRNGIFLLILLILILLGGMIAVRSFSPSSEVELDVAQQKEIEGFRQQIDSLKAAKETKTFKIYPFNPNFITDYKGYTLGMTPQQIDSLHAFRDKDQWINSTEDFQRVTKVSDSLLKKIAKHFKFPDWVNNKSTAKPRYSKRSSAIPEKAKADLNSVSSEELRHINGIGEVLSKRITRYRSKLNGFVNDVQLKDIYGLDYEVEERILQQYTVKNPPEIEKLDINRASVIALSEVVYLNYELARKIVNYRKLHEGIKSFEELAKIKDFPSYKIDRLKLYVEIN